MGTDKQKPYGYDIYSVFNEYKSPIKIEPINLAKKVNEYVDNKIHEEIVQQYGVFVDKDELLKALQYDRHQYEAGFQNGYNHAIKELTSCRGCKYVNTPYRNYPCTHCCRKLENLFEEGEPVIDD